MTGKGGVTRSRGPRPDSNPGPLHRGQSLRTWDARFTGWANGRPSYIFTWAAFGLLSHRERVLSGCVIGHLFWKYHIFYLTLSHPFSSSIRTQTLENTPAKQNRTCTFPPAALSNTLTFKGWVHQFYIFYTSLGEYNCTCEQLYSAWWDSWGSCT